MLRPHKAQSALEFLITYSWAILALLAFMAALYYFGQFNGLQYAPAECSMGLDLPCMSYRISQSTGTGYEVFLVGRNDIGFDMGFQNQTFVLTAENLGLPGSNSYTGNCSPSLVQKGHVFSCLVSIPYVQRVPRIGTTQRVGLAFTYKNCDSNPAYPSTGNCSAALTVNHTVSGWISSPVEPSTSAALCGNSVCDDNLGENSSTCPGDCASVPYTITLALNASSMPNNGSAAILVTAGVYDQFNRPVSGALVNFTKSSWSGTLSAVSNTTNAAGQASVRLNASVSWAPETFNVMAYYNNTWSMRAEVPVTLTGYRWNASFAYYAPVSIYSGVTSNLTNFPARITLDTASLISAGKMNSSCKDLRIVNSSFGGLLDYEIENATCDTAATAVWVRVPRTNGTQGYPAYIFYGNLTTADAQNKAGVWNNNYSGVWHLSDLADSAQGNTLTNNNARRTSGASGIPNTAYSFDGITSYLYAADNNSLDMSGKITVTALVYPRALPAETSIASKGGAASCGNYDFYIHDGQVTLLSDGGGCCNWAYGGANSIVYNNTWSHIGASYVGSNITYFINGVQKDNKAWGGIGTPNAGTLEIGKQQAGSLGWFNGTMDELRLANASRTADWMYAEYAQTSILGSEQSNR